MHFKTLRLQVFPAQGCWSPNLDCIVVIPGAVDMLVVTAYPSGAACFLQCSEDRRKFQDLSDHGSIYGSIECKTCLQCSRHEKLMPELATAVSAPEVDIWEK